MKSTCVVALALAACVGMALADFSGYGFDSYGGDSYGSGYGSGYGGSSYGGGYGGGISGGFLPLPISPSGGAGVGDGGFLMLIGMLFIILFLFNGNNSIFNRTNSATVTPISIIQG